MTTPTRLTFLKDLAHRIADLPTDHPVRIRVDGVDASGKTTLANELVAPVQAAGLPVIRASIDGFHRPRAERYQLGRHSPEGFFHHSFNHGALTAPATGPECADSVH
jgi:uridine kinase